jgi:hypothetical protein
LEYIAAAYPLDGSKTNYVRRRLRAKMTLDINALKPQPVENVDSPTWYNAILDKLASMLSSTNEQLVKRGEKPFDRITLFLNPTDSAEIMSGALGWGQRPGVASLRAGGSETILAHEMGHNFGLDDEYKKATPETSPAPPNPRRTGAGMSPPDADANANFVEEGVERLWPLSVSGSPYLAVTADVDVAGITLPDVYYRMQTFMGGDFPNKWTDLAERKYLFEKLRLPTAAAARAQSLAAATADVVYAQGFISTSDQVKVTRLARGTSAPVAPPPGDYVFELLNSGGKNISSSSFGLNFQLPHGGPERHALFSVGAPFVQGAVTVRIRRGSKVLYSHPISANAPNVQILSPASGQAVNGPLTITWTAGGLDGD